jgi:hypothetical protein
MRDAGGDVDRLGVLAFPSRELLPSDIPDDGVAFMAGINELDKLAVERKLDCGERYNRARLRRRDSSPDSVGNTVSKRNMDRRQDTADDLTSISLSTSLIIGRSSSTVLGRNNWSGTFGQVLDFDVEITAAGFDYDALAVEPREGKRDRDLENRIDLLGRWRGRTRVVAQRKGPEGKAKPSKPVFALEKGSCEVGGNLTLGFDNKDFGPWGVGGGKA